MNTRNLVLLLTALGTFSPLVAGAGLVSVNGPGACTPYSVTLPSPATNETSITLTINDPTIATFEDNINPINITFPAGSVTPEGRMPLVCGVNFGTTFISSSAGIANPTIVNFGTRFVTSAICVEGLHDRGRAPMNQCTVMGSVAQVIVSGALSFYPATVTASAWRQERLTLGLSAPAPAGGLTVTLVNTNPTVASVPATVTIPGGATSVIVPVTPAGTGIDTILAIDSTATTVAPGSATVSFQ